MGKRETPMSLTEAVHLAKSRKSKALARAAGYLIGCPVGGWPETQQAKARIADELPVPSMRSFTSDDFISEAYEIDHADRYRAKAGHTTVARSEVA